MLKNKFIKIFSLFNLILSFNTNAIASDSTLLQQKPVDITIKKHFQSKNIVQPQKGLENILLWEVISPDKMNKSYFAGTIHIPFREGFEIPESFTDHIKECNKYVDEIDLSNLTDLPRTLAKYAFDPSINLQKKIAPEKWKMLLSRMKKGGMAENYVKLMKPWYLVLFMQMQEVKEDSGIKSQESQGGIQAKEAPEEKNIEDIKDKKPAKIMDAALQANAMDNNLEITHLETIDEQFQIISSALTDQEYLKMLDDILILASTKKANNQDLKKAGELNPSIVETYNSNDLENFAKISSATEKYSLKYYDALIRIRNEKWTERLEQMLVKNNLFVAVGALHLVGKKGILKSLEKKGYQVNFMPLKP